MPSDLSWARVINNDIAGGDQCPSQACRKAPRYSDQPIRPGPHLRGVLSNRPLDVGIG